MRPIYSGCVDAALTDTSHRGLFFERFFEYGNNWSVGEDEKKRFLEEIAKRPCGNKDALESTVLRRKEMLKALGGEYRVLETQWNFVTGMGLPHPFENGLSWHPTLGVPYLAGSGVKGLLRAWYEQWSDKSEDSIRSWFGPSFDELREKRAEPAAGNLIFFDAIPVDTVELVMDIMTPHMGKWYEKGGKIGNATDEPESVPADWHDPTPIPFLAVKKAKVLFSIAPSQRLADTGEINKAMDALTEALEYLGAGAKTAAGYGRMEENRADKSERERAERDAQLANLSFEDRLRADVSQLTENNLAIMFGRDFKKTFETQKDLKFYLSIIREIHGNKIQAWKGSKEKNREKAYKRIFGAVHE